MSDPQSPDDYGPAEDRSMNPGYRSSPEYGEETGYRYGSEYFSSTNAPPQDGYEEVPFEYERSETFLGARRSYRSSSGDCFVEIVSHANILGLPLFHYTRGRCPETGKRIVAMGVIAVGRLAVGGLAIGQASAGLIAIGQLAIGMGFGLGQAATGVVALGQAALGLLFGLGQVATGYVAIGQFAVGQYVLAQLGLGRYVWDMYAAAPAARTFFRGLIGQ